MELIAGRLKVVVGDIALAKTGAVVNAANTELWMGAGVAGALKAKGGDVIEREAIAQGPIKPGGCVLTTGGNLFASYVIHVATMEPGGSCLEEYVRKGTTCALSLAKDNEIDSIAFPALGTGVGGLSLKECARVMLKEISHWLNNNDLPGLVEIVLYDEKAYQVFLDVWNELKLEGEL